MSDFPSSLRDGRYAVMGVLGEGSQAQTLTAVDKREGRPVAIKRFIVRGARSWKDVELAEREARVLSSLSHPHLPAYVEHFEENGELFLVMEQVEGESLQQLRKRGGRLERAEILRLLAEIGAVLDYLHGQAPPIIHRDIKPGNVIRRPDGRFTLVDFGSVRDRLRPEGGSTVVGTFGYMAPEQFQGRALPQTDVYALGATALSLMTGEEPDQLPHQGLRLDVQRALPNDPELARLLAQLLEPDPDKRASRVLPLLDRSFAGRSGRARRAAPKEQSADAVDEAATEPEPAPLRQPPRGEPLPPFVLVILLLGLAIARVAVRIPVGVFVPMLLVLLGVLFGDGLRRAAQRVRLASRRADEALKRAARKVRRLEFAHEHPPGIHGRTRVRVATDSGAPPRRARVIDTTAEPVEEPEESERSSWHHEHHERRR